MEIIVFEKEAYYRMVEELKKAVQEATRETVPEPKEWLSTQEAKELLGVRSKSKMQQLRDDGQIEFSQHGRIIRYNRASILAFLRRNTVK